MNHTRVIVVTILVITGLTATPLALLARGVYCDNTPCMCSMMHMGHSAGQICHCPMESGHHAIDFGFIAPMAPTHTIPTAKLGAPVSFWRSVLNFGQSPLSRSTSEPFEPPRV